MSKKISCQIFLLLLISVSLSVTSCIPHLRGNGKVVKQERQISGFIKVSVSTGIALYINQDSIEKVTVEADENIIKVIKTEVSGGHLQIYLDEPILHAKKLNVYLCAKKLSSIDCSSGSQVKSSGTFHAETLRVEASSGSNAKLDVKCNDLKVSSSSGSDIEITGTSNSISAHSSSGSQLDASGLIAESGNANSSSGSDLRIQATKSIKADVSSGSKIKVYGNPDQRDTQTSSGGDVNFR